MAERSETQESSPEVELLVHIGAPSLGPDDARYRALASAYSNFKQKTRTKIPLREGPPNTQRSISDTQFSFEGVDDNLDSPYLPRGGARQDDPDTQASFVSLPSVVQDSIPDNLATFAGYGSPSRVLNFYTSSLDTSQRTPIAPRRRDEAPPSSSDAGQRVGNAGTPTRRLFTQTRPRPTAALNAIDPTDSDEPSLPPDRKRQRTGGSSADRRTKRRRTGAAPKPNDPDDDDDDDDDSDDEDPINPPPKTPRDKRLLGERYAQQSLYQRDWVFGPPMPIKETNEGKAIPLHPLDLFTPALDEVMGSLNGNHYMTASILRKLRHFERGYWIVDVRSWNDGLRRAFWNFLSEYIERGLAGWGVSAMRDRHNSTFTWVRLYGWGALAREMYLLLYLTSQRAVKGTGLCWYDAKHRVCVRMPTVEGGGPKESQRREGGPENVPAPPLGNVDHLLDGRPDPEALAEEPPAPKGTTPPPATPPPRPATPVYGSQTPPMGQGSPFRPRPQ
ncbi:hypothetical protein QBC43DRAFT_273041 [Cladorrhinum sp. PSN259]|nr:hypothetical protein QBC43DRAFT_273041 [Cladorrhinum sp. PSN259]